MPITTHQLRQRRSHLGSSDVAALFGLNRFQSVYDVWLDKTGQLEEQQPRKEWLELGNEFEPIILARAQKELGRLRRNQYRSAKDKGLPLASNIDAIVVETGRPVEAKTCGIWWPAPEQWGEPGTAEVPDRVLIQAQVHMICTDTDLCHAPCMGWGLQQEMYEVPRDEEMVRQIEDYCRSWWQKHVVEGREPQGAPTLAAVKRRVRKPQKAVEVPQQLIEKWRRAVKLHTRVGHWKEDAWAAVLAALGDAEIGTCPAGTVMYLAEQRRGYVVAPKTIRVARWKENKNR